VSDIAIVGMGCRFAGAQDLQQYWRLVKAGENAFGPVPENRWDSDAFFSQSNRDADRSTSPTGAFIEDVRSFPALHLGIPPRRVEVMDPQQRFTIELAREAIEDAGYAPSTMPTNTGVYVGLTAHEYRFMLSGRIMALMMASGQLGEAPDDPTALAQAVERIVPPRPFSAPGGLGNMSAAAVAQELDLRGPAYTLDAACASAMIAVADAVAQLRAGQIDAAIAGGVYLQLTPNHFIAFSRIGAMSKQGQCLPFDARADGFVQGDGVGMIVLKRHEDAIRDGDRVYALLRGVGVNNDGRGDGPMAPLLRGQIGAIETAWTDAGVSPAKATYIETHGTGTSVGDAVESEGIRTVFADATNLALGSAKANIGHTMSAAGIAGLIKAALAIHHQVIPPMASFQQPRADLALAEHGIVVPQEAQPWADKERLAGVSSFGFGGTNAHVVLSAAPQAATTETDDLQLVTFSAADTVERSRLAGHILDAIEHQPETTVAAVAHALASRTPLACRAAIIARDIPSLTSALRSIRDGADANEGTWLGESTGTPKIALLYPGQGAQRVGMMRDIIARFPQVRARMRQLEDALQDDLDTPLGQLLFPETRSTPVSADEASAELTRTQNCQPAMLAVSLALTDLLAAVGIRPTVVAGHSLGEFTAAAAAGVVAADEAARFVARRGRAMAHLEGEHGTMAAIMAPAEDVRALLVDGAVIANENHPRQAVVSGTHEAVQRVIARAERADIRAKALDVSHAFHSPLLASLDAAALIDGMTFSAPVTTVASAIIDRPWATPDDAREVFLRHATSPVLFTEALAQCQQAEADLYLQVGAGGPLASFARGTVPRDHRGVYTLASRDDHDGGKSLLDTLGALWVAGVDLDVRAITTPSLAASMPASRLPREIYWGVKEVPQRAIKLAGVTPRARVTAAPETLAPTPSAPEIVEASTEDDATAGVMEVVAKVSAYPKSSLRSTMRLAEDLGFDSLMVGDLATGLAERFPQLGGIPQELLINGPTITDLIEYVATGGAPAQTQDDDAPLTAYRPVFTRMPHTTLPAVTRDCGAIAVTGESPSLADALARDLDAAGCKTHAVHPTDVLDNDADTVVWILPTGRPSLEAVLEGTATRPDLVAPLLQLLATLERARKMPHLVVVDTERDAWSGAVAGAVHAVARDWPHATVKLIQTPQHDSLAQTILGELASADRTIHVRYDGAERYVTSFVKGDISENIPTAVGQSDTVLITGGTRGIGLKVGLALASTAHRVLLMGRSVPSETDRATITAFPNIETVRADVTDRDAIRKALAGHDVHVLIHAAGVLADGPLAEVDAHVGAKARAVKVDGWLNTIAACRPHLRQAVGIGSWAGRFGNRHQAHYAAANAQLAALTDTLPADIQAVVGEYGPWSQSAMAASIPATIQSAMRADGVDFVGDDAGLQAILADLGRSRGAIVHGRRVPTSLRVVETWRQLSIETDPFLLDHAIDGKPIFPLASATDLMAMTADLSGALTIEDVTLYRGVVVDQPVRLQITHRLDKAEIRAEDGTLHYQARVRPSSQISDVPAAHRGGSPPSLALKSFYDDVTFHGPLLQGIKTIDAIENDFVAGTLVGGSPTAWTPGETRERFTADPLIIDSAMQLSAYVAWVRYRRAGTPVSIQRVHVLAPSEPGATYQAEAHFGEATEDRFAADLIVRDSIGRPILWCENVVAELRKAEESDPQVDTAQAVASTDLSTWPEVMALQARLDGVAAMGLSNPYFHVHDGTARDTTSVCGQELVNFSSYNYVGLSGDPEVVADVQASVARYGTSVSASRVASGERPFHGELERLLAKAQGAEDALLFTAGHATNVTTIGHLLGPDDLVLHDEYIHDSALQGIKLSGAARRGFRHEEPEHLEQQLIALRPHYRRCLIVVEGVYSMDGDICDLPAYVAIKKRHNCLLMVDEAHSFGIVGATGCGVAEHHGVDGGEIDIWMGTLSKSMASCGGWIAGSKSLITYLRYTAPGFVYSAGLTAANGIAALSALKKLLREPERVKTLQDNAAFFHEHLVKRGLNTGPARGGSAVIPVITGNSLHAMILSQRLLAAGINVQPIVYPAVPEDAARLRYFLSSTHSREQLQMTAEQTAQILTDIREQFPST
jgi:8-amino-7-oxononanoate synthase